VRRTAVVLAVMIVMAEATFLLALRTYAGDFLDDARIKAADQGYAIADSQELDVLLGQHPTPLIIDVRPDYEFNAGHIPNARNLEFDLGDTHTLNSDKKTRFLALAGTDKTIPLIFYCRSVSCIRSEIAARWAVRLGYSKVIRYPFGWHGWKEHHPETSVATSTVRILGTGDRFPECRLAMLGKDADRKYLSMIPDNRWLTLQDVPAPYVLVAFYNSLCVDCVRQMAVTNEIFREVENDTQLKARLRIIGIGVYNTKLETRRFRKRHKVLFPLFSDRDGLVFECLGQTKLPLAYLVRRDAAGNRIIALVRNDFSSPGQDLLDQIRAVVDNETP